MSAALASKDCDIETSVDKLIEDGWAEVASGLRENWGQPMRTCNRQV